MHHRVEANRLFNRAASAGLAALYAVLAATTATAAGWAVGANGLVIKSVDAGATWTASNPVVQTLNGVHFVNDDVGWAVGANGAVSKTIDGGDHWSTTTPTTRTLNDVFFIDETHGWAVGSYGAVLRTINGVNWTASSPTTAELYGVHFIDQNTGWAVGAGVTLRTTNGGTNWTVTSPTTSTLRGVFFVNATTGWAVGSAGVVIKTVNGGASWTVSTATSVGLNSVRFVSANVGFAVGASGAVLKTTNGGTDWTEQHPVPGALNAVFFIDAMNGWAVGVNGVQIKTTNAGESWAWSTPAAVELNDIFFASVAYLEVTVQTSPAGRSYSVDGIDYASAQTFNWFAGDPHVIATTTPQAGGTDTRYVWTGWSDAGAISHVVAPLVDATYTASFDTQYQLTMNASTGGTVTPPTSWRDPGEIVTITATPDAAYDFLGWNGVGSGSYTGPDNPTTVTMDAPVTQTATFDPQMLVTVATDPSGRSITVDGGDYTSPRSFAWLPGSSHTIGVASPQATGGSRYTWTSWSDGGAQSHSVSPNADITYTASFSTEYLLTMQSSAGGSVSPVSTWRPAGSVIPIHAAADSGYVFAGWTGTGSGSYSGPDSLAFVTLNGPITESASFHQEGFPGTPTALTLLGNVPNPFSAQTEIRVGLPHAADVAFDIFDVTGQRVFSERKSGVPSGWSTFTFRTANSTGGSLASGIYFLRVTSIGQVQSQRLVLIR